MPRHVALARRVVSPLRYPARPVTADLRGRRRTIAPLHGLPVRKGPGGRYVSTMEPPFTAIPRTDVSALHEVGPHVIVWVGEKDLGASKGYVPSCMIRCGRGAYLRATEPA